MQEIMNALLTFQKYLPGAILIDTEVMTDNMLQLL